jgi:hypothetical protein
MKLFSENSRQVCEVVGKLSPTGAAWEIELFKSITNDMEPDVEGQLQEPLTEEAHDDVSFQIITISPDSGKQKRNSHSHVLSIIRG